MPSPARPVSTRTTRPASHGRASEIRPSRWSPSVTAVFGSGSPPPAIQSPTNVTARAAIENLSRANGGV